MADPQRVVVFGDVFDDIVAVPVGEIRADTDTEASIRLRAGGSAANAATWLGSLGTAVDFIGRVGAADLERHSALLAAAGVTPHLIADPALPTGTIVVIVEGAERSMLTEKGANALLTADDVTDAMLGTATLVHFTGYSLFGSGREDAVRRLMKRAADQGVLVSVDPGSAGFIADFGPDRFLDAIDGATLLFPNLEEGRLLTGLEQPEEIAVALAARFAVVAITLDSEGAIVAEGDGVHRIAAAPATVADPTGAGDAFAAGFIAKWLRNRDAVAAAASGVRAGALAVSTSGGRPTA